MAPIRKPYQGVINIIRFNWHFYAIGIALFTLAIIISENIEVPKRVLVYIPLSLAVISVIISLVISWCIYDLSGLYDLDWLEKSGSEQLLVNIHAGFDETSVYLMDKFPGIELRVFDFYDPVKHTEISIKRARIAYPPSIPTTTIDTNHLPIDSGKADKIFLLLSAHEIRNDLERIHFFREIHRTLKPAGKIYILEHLRDLPNFLGFSIGFLHFHSKDTWRKTFTKAGFTVECEKKHTPFLSLFILQKNGNTF